MHENILAARVPTCGNLRLNVYRVLCLVWRSREASTVLAGLTIRVNTRIWTRARFRKILSRVCEVVQYSSTLISGLLRLFVAHDYYHDTIRHRKTAFSSKFFLFAQRYRTRPPSPMLFTIHRHHQDQTSLQVVVFFFQFLNVVVTALVLPALLYCCC